MKKFLALAISLLLICSFPISTLAADTTILTTTVPDAIYTLNIPKNQEIPFGATETNIGSVTVTESAGFAVGKDLQVSLAYDAFKADGVLTTIPYTVYRAAKQSFTIGGSSDSPFKYPVLSGEALVFRGNSSGAVAQEFKMETNNYNVTEKHLETIISSEDWGKALAGDYSSTITFTAEVVVSE